MPIGETQRARNMDIPFQQSGGHRRSPEDPRIREWGVRGGVEETTPPKYMKQAVPVSQHHEAALTRLQVSRTSYLPHHRARMAAAVSRTVLHVAPSFYDRNAPSPPPIQTNEQQWQALDIGGMLVRSLPVMLFDYDFLTTLYINNNSLAYLPPAISRLRNLVHLDASANKLSALPPELGLLPRLQCLYLFDNLLSGLPWELGSLYMLEHLGLEGNPNISDSIMSVLQKEGTGALIAYLRDRAPAFNPPSERIWVEASTEPRGQEDCFSIFCYNILSEKYATPKQYGYTPSWALEWKFRGTLIIQEIEAYAADIACLQEVEMQQFDEFKRVLAESCNFDSVYLCKSRAKTLLEKDRKSVDGCATFYNKQKFEYVDKQYVEFNQCALQKSDKPNDHIFNRLALKDNIALFVLLRHLPTKRLVLVVNCHIHWDPAFCDVKLIQVILMMERLQSALSQYSKQYDSKIAVLICGDFNSTPDSGVHGLLCTGNIEADHQDFLGYKYFEYTNIGYAHDLSLASAYDRVKIPFTNFTPTFKNIIDYVWYTNSTLRVMGVLAGVSEEYCKRCIGFPNVHFPSDHIPLLAEVQLIL